MRLFILCIIISLCFGCASSLDLDETPPRFAVSLKDGYAVAYNEDTVSFSYLVSGKKVTIKEDKNVLFFFDDEYLFQQQNTPLFFVLTSSETNSMSDEQILRKHMEWEFDLHNQAFGGILELNKEVIFNDVNVPYLIWSYKPGNTSQMSTAKSIEYIFCTVRIKDQLCIFEIIVTGDDGSDRGKKLQAVKKVVESITIHDEPASTGQIKNMYLK